MKFIFTSFHNYWLLIEIVQHIIILCSNVKWHFHLHWPTAICNHQSFRRSLSHNYWYMCKKLIRCRSLSGTDCMTWVIIKYRNELSTHLLGILYTHTVICYKAIFVQFCRCLANGLTLSCLWLKCQQTFHTKHIISTRLHLLVWPDPKIPKHHLIIKFKVFWYQCLDIASLQTSKSCAYIAALNRCILRSLTSTQPWDHRNQTLSISIVKENTMSCC